MQDDFEIIEKVGPDHYKVRFKFSGEEDIFLKEAVENGDIQDKSQDDLTGGTFLSRKGKEYQVIKIDHKDKHYNKYYLIKFLDSGNEKVARRGNIRRGEVKDKKAFLDQKFKSQRDELDFIVQEPVGRGLYLCYFPETKQFTTADKTHIKEGSVNPKRTRFYRDEELISVNLTAKNPDGWDYSGISIKDNAKAIKVWNSVRFVKKPKEVVPQIRRLKTFKKLIPYDLEEKGYLDVPVVLPKRTTITLKPKDLRFSLTN